MGSSEYGIAILQVWRMHPMLVKLREFRRLHLGHLHSYRKDGTVVIVNEQIGVMHPVARYLARRSCLRINFFAMTDVLRYRRDGSISTRPQRWLVPPVFRKS